jgi:hypothetical protein
MSDTLRFVAAADKLSVDDILVPFVLGYTFNPSPSL